VYDDLKSNPQIRLLVDSGAFTAWKTGRHFSLDDYCKALDHAQKRIPIWRYFTLDVIGDADGTRRNYDELKRRGYDPIPIFTRGAAQADLEYYYERTELVGVGGLVGTTGSRGFVNGIMRCVGSRAVHLLGFTRFDFMKHYRPYSCDSSNFNRGGKYGWVDIYVGAGHMPHLMRTTVKHGNISSAIASTLHRYGFDPWSLGRPSGWTGKDAPAVKIPYFSWVDFSLDAERNIGTKVFLACSPADLSTMLQAYERVHL